MSQTPDSEALLQQFQSLLESHSGDRSRWPAAERLRFAPLIAGEARARTALAEAAALDRLLDTAPSISIERERALATRIMSAATAAPLVASRPLAPLADEPRGTVVALRRTASARPSFAARGPAAALLAASLVFGMVVGSTGSLTPAVTFLAEAVGLADDEAEIAMVGEGTLSAEEAL